MSGRDRFHAAIGVFGLAAGVAAAAVAATSDWDPQSDLEIALTLIVGWSFIAGGILALRRRPGNWFGALLAAVGFAWFASQLALANSAALFTAGFVLEPLFIGFFAHALLAYPTERLESPVARAVVAAVYLDVTVVQLAIALVHAPDAGDVRSCPCPENLIALTDHDGLYSTLTFIQQPVAGVVLGIAAVAILARRWRVASAPLRRALAPVYLTGGLSIAVIVAEVVLAQFSARAAEVAQLLGDFTFASVPAAFVVGLVQTRLARAAVGELVVELGTTPPASDLREDALRRVLGDPTLTLAVWDTEAEAFVDAAGVPVELPREGDSRAATIMEREGEVVGALVHDGSLRENWSLLEPVAAAVGLALENERRLAQLTRSEATNRALLDAIPDLMFVITRDGTYVDVTGDEALLAAPADVLIGSNIFDVLPLEPAERIMRSVRNALSDGRVHSVEYELAIDGRPRYFEARVVRGSGDEVVLIVRDFTERKRKDEELRASRARIVEAGDVERRRLERNLHDGAQQRLVSLSVALRLLEGKLESSPQEARAILETAGEELSLALNELRELARGIHPAILSDRGLEPALEALAGRTPVPVEVDTSIESRLPPPVEAAAYFVVSEALANVTKYAEATSASVRVFQDDGRAVVEVADDGVGGADPSGGSGLRGLVDRVEALDGRLEVKSRPGRGTTIRAEIPCA